MRKTISLLILIDLIFLFLTSVILYTVPAGRVAYWSNWTLWGFSKTQWTEVHVNLGLLFVIGSIIHLVYNWQAIVRYMKNRAKQFRMFTREFNIALIITLVIIVTTLMKLPPVYWVNAFSENIKEGAADVYGEPPYGHAELSSLRVFAKRTSLDVALAAEQMTKAGLQYENENQTLLEIATLNSISPQNLYNIIISARLPSEPSGVLPDEAVAGTGKRQLADLCAEYHLNLKIVIREMADAGIDADPEMTLKAIAEKHERHVSDIYAVLKQVSQLESGVQE